MWWNNSAVRRKLIPLYYTLCTIFLAGCAQKPYKETRLLMGTMVEITIRDNEARAKDAADKAFKKIEELEKILSVYRKDSEISTLNRTGKVNPSPEFMQVIKESIRAGDITEGAFDITVAPIVSLWGFGPPSNVGQTFRSAKNNPPAEKEIKKALALVNYKNIVIDEKNNLIYFKKKGMQVNLGGIAKGYAVDRAIDVLKKEGIKKAIINAGGDLYAMGITWRIGIKHPRKEGILKTIVLKNKTIATSGDYEKFFIGTYEGKKKQFHHIFDPRTGYPAQGCISATVIAPACTTADWLSTGVFVLGPEKGLTLLKKLGGQGIIVNSDKKIFSNL
ncbi:hypothetical protein AUJ66_01225 [Candidatus Desantisbacteria bacterium CG1_02_38_46]|uniref:FAD:protein FMN transferase n=3 Tax=unclassified Candidatus Desantisiibacteriota TaxID=3106372 RepID=A0A2H9PBX8_9BACT|nr:MAG: hypothetical protein AUJ66_01225 [Candidatus Desantisbacteria bacterium CG1_02_38_46]PIU51234.1 MAG: hypothetical protein COS91_05500 [Candidatus Desantisbacteria bacterium CG07_land_8_20_14_0_80_39_15]PIZ16509.1 MAG: hypothetical protein COY51_02610 [Candidatus Desantisbacteria bacterium CG_4_10_14_0_8_um_filter_39_17]